jgi:hypothetical protein
MVHEHTGSFGHVSSFGSVGSFGHVGPQRGMTHPKDVMVHKSDVWTPYKSTRHMS